ncbi:MAG TPA: carboxypeptidase-like regulatory domain-containing protein [Acidobacteriaceae bacterium]|jgi:hypothetical protein|nr:carboxypeptidase-like regulatory domain-containing protein [Acidobacteriaceae bacterium]
MKPIALVLVSALLALWSPIGSAQAGSGALWPWLTRPTYPAGGKTYRVTGRVLDNRTGKPMGGATVCLERQNIYSGGGLCQIPPPGFDRGTTTDADGHFVLDGVPSGRIFVSAAMPGYVLALRHRIGIETWAETDLTSDWSVDLYLARPASVSGIARDHTGALIGKDRRNGDIELFYVEDDGGWPRSAPFAVTPTFDADGTYHFDKLYAGRYFLVVDPRNQEEPGGTKHNRPVGEVPLRYPQPTWRHPAPLFTLQEGERKQVDLQIAEKTLHHVAYTDRSTFGYQLRDRSGVAFGVQQSPREKDARYAWLPDGYYSLSTMTPGAGNEPVFFRVAGADVSGLHLEGDPDEKIQAGVALNEKGVPVTVQVSIDGSPDLHCLHSHPGDCDLADLQLIDVEPDGMIGGGADLHLTASTKTLATTLQPDRYTAFVISRQNFYVKSLRSGAINLSRGLLPIHRGQTPAPIRVELAPGASIEGRVERNRKPVVAWVYALPADRAARASFRFFDPVETRADGTFAMDGLAPASWILFASEIGNLQVDIRDPADTAYWRRHGKRVHTETSRTAHLVVKEALRAR